MIDLTTASFVVIDDLLRALGWQEDCRRYTSDAKMITTALAAALFSSAIKPKPALRCTKADW